MLRRGTMRALIGVGAGLTALVAPAAAHATEIPSACLSRPQATAVDGSTMGVAVFGYVNGNTADESIPLGGDNVIVQAPNFRNGQPVVFSPGRHEPAWFSIYNPARVPVLTWYLQGATATDDAVCGGGGPVAPIAIPTLGDGAASAAVGDSLAIAADRTSGDVSIQVERCLDAACVPISFATQPNGSLVPYTVQAADAGYDLRIRAMRLTMRHGWSSAISTRVSIPGPATGPAPKQFTDATAVAPEPLTQPSTSGTAGEGYTLTADPGDWAGTPVPAIAVRWQRCDATACTDIPGVTGTTYVPGGADVGDRLRAVVDATADGLTTFEPGGSVIETAASEPTAAVTAAPSLVSAPVIAGRPDVGAALTVTDPGRFGTTVTRAIQWQSCAGTACQDVTGATGSTYVVRAADAGRELRAQVVATTAGGRTVATSNGVGPAGAVRNATAPALIGGAVVGTPVWTDGGSWIGVPAPGVQFGWLRCDAAGNACVPIGGATGPGYTPTSADLGRTLRAGVTATNGFSSATATSAASAPVAAPTPASAPKADRTRPVVSGLAAMPRRFRAGRGLTRLAPVRSRRVRTGTILRVRLSEKAFVQVDVTRRRHGRRQIVATLTRVLGKGTHRLGFTGRLSPAQGGTLPRGAYVLAVRATDAAGNVSRERGVGISVVR